jgi:hypothetical protein
MSASLIPHYHDWMGVQAGKFKLFSATAGFSGQRQFCGAAIFCKLLRLCWLKTIQIDFPFQRRPADEGLDSLRPHPIADSVLI